MPKYAFEKPIQGTDQLSDETSLQEETYRRISNADVDRAGNISRRAGFVQRMPGAGYHSLYSSEKRGWILLCYKNELGRYLPDSDSFLLLDDMPDAYMTSFTEENGNLYAMNPTYAGMIRAGNTTVEPIGVQLPNVSVEFAVVADSGTLEPGAYGITYSVVDSFGEESGLAPVQKIELVEQSGIQGTLFTVISGAKYRIYLTAANGEELYQAAEFPASTTSYLVAEHQMGRVPETHGLEPVPKGHIVRAYNSRLLIGSNGLVYFTEAFRPHLYNPSHGFVIISGMATMIEPVDNGVFIGDKRGVMFYAGDDTTNWQLKQVSSERVVFNTSLVVPGEQFGEDFARFDHVAVWLTASGYYLGLPSGEAVRVSATRLKLPSYVQGCAAYYVEDGRKQLVTPVNSNTLADIGVAIDSVIN